MWNALNNYKKPCPKPPRSGRPTCRPNQSPLGFRPGLISNRDKFEEDGSIRQRFTRYESQISNYNPFAKNPVQMDELIEKWGQMALRDTTHGHGKYSPPRHIKI